MIARQERAWLRAIPAFLTCLPPAFFVGISLIGHGRSVPYVSEWSDRLVLVAVALGLPLLAGFGVHRLASEQRGKRDSRP